MGYIRFAHFAAGQVMAAAFVGRIYWAFVGNAHAKQLFYVPFWRKSFWQGWWLEIRWYLFLEKYPKQYVGHNPLAHTVMFGVFTLVTLFMICTGFALYSEGAGRATGNTSCSAGCSRFFPTARTCIPSIISACGP